MIFSHTAARSAKTAAWCTTLSDAIKKPEESKQKWDLYEYLATVAGDDAFRPIAEGGCPDLANRLSGAQVLLLHKLH